MVVRIKTSGIQGIDSYPIDVEVHISKGRSGFSIIGLGDNAVKEAGERVRTAIVRAGFKMPKRTLINLAPAEIKKEGSSFDLPIAIAVLCASGQIEMRDISRVAFCGELSLGGHVKGVRGIVALSLGALRAGCTVVVVPEENASAAGLIPELAIVPVRSLLEAVRYIATGEARRRVNAAAVSTARSQRCMVDVRGQERAKRALTIAAVGGHHVLMVGPPGCGKSMLAERFGSLLPPLLPSEILEVAQIHSIAGLSIEPLLRGERPYRAPHHGVSEAGLIGGGSVPRPGEISLAHRGVLFLDELPEFRRAALESLRAPLEARSVSVARARGSVQFPAHFQLIAAMNPCPCGRSGVPRTPCLCGAQEVSRYLRKLSQPLLDRFDIQLELDAVTVSQLTEPGKAESAAIRESEVHEMRLQLLETRGEVNGGLSNSDIDEISNLDRTARLFLKQIAERGLLSARGYYRVLRVSRTIADMLRADRVRDEHIAEAVQFRSLDRMTAQLARS